MCFLKRSNLKKYHRLLEQLQEIAYLGRYEYPQTTVDVYDILILFSGKFKSVGERYRQNSTRNQGRGKGTNRGAELSLTQAATGGALTGKDRVTHAKITCYNCNARKHYSGKCPSTNRRTNDVTSLQFSAFFTRCLPSTEDIIHPNWIILDSASTATTIKNKALLSNTRDCPYDKTLLVHTNGGDKTFHQQGDLKIVLMTAHYNPTFLANIFLMKDVQIFGAYASRRILLNRVSC